MYCVSQHHSRCNDHAHKSCTTIVTGHISKKPMQVLGGCFKHRDLREVRFRLQLLVGSGTSNFRDTASGAACAGGNVSPATHCCEPH